MALFSQARAQGYDVDNENEISPFVSVSNRDTPDKIQSPAAVSVSSMNLLSGDIHRVKKGSTPNPPYTLRLQSNYFCDDRSGFTAAEINIHLNRDLHHRVTQVREGLLVERLFPDDAFGFSINELFVANFYNSFVSNAGYLDDASFHDEQSTEIYLNRTILTVAHVLNATKQVLFKPLRYFSSAFSNKAPKGQVMKRKPDIVLLSLVDGHLQDHEGVHWDDVQAIVEHTREKKIPQRLPETISVKSFLAFCSQPDRDFIVTLCITSKGYHIVMTDHTGHVETDVIPFSNSVVFLRLVMGLAFLPDNFNGKDPTITRKEAGKTPSVAFNSAYQIFSYSTPAPSIKFRPVDGLFTGASIPTSGSSGSIDAMSSSVSQSPYIPPSSSIPPSSPGEISTISIGPNIYKVIRVLFKTKTMIGRATTVFLVQLPDNRLGVLKDSWITTDRPEEAKFLQNLYIPFGPEVVDHCALRNTYAYRENPILPSLNPERREKRRIVTYPAGVHISDFTSLWELLVAFLDIVIAILHLETQNKVHRDISYTNILLRERDDSNMAARENVMKELGLSEIEKLRKSLDCREGLLIDFDYGTSLPVEPTAETNSEGEDVSAHIGPGSGTRTGTGPFMAIELLQFGVPHRVAHDLESLFYVLLFICTHLGGPRNTLGNPPLYGGVTSCDHPSQMRKWFIFNNLIDVGFMKYAHMAFFEITILPFISLYFRPLQQFLSLWWKKILPRQCTPNVMDSVHSVVTCRDIIEIFKIILMDDTLISMADQAPKILGKCSLPGELDHISDSWDVMRPTKRKSKQDSPLTPRSCKLMLKGQKGV